MLPRNPDISRTLIFIILGLLAVSCQSNWEVALENSEGMYETIDIDTYLQLDQYLETQSDREALPLERLLEKAGHRIVDQVNVNTEDSDQYTYLWSEIADQAWLLENGSLMIGEDILTPISIEVQPSDWLADVEASITDIAPTVAQAMGIDSPDISSGRLLTQLSSEHVLLLFLDGFGYLQYQEAHETGLIPNLSELGEPLVGITVYPPVTVVASAALLTGAEPAMNGVTERSTRKTESETLFDIAADAGLSVQAVEGEALAFQLRNAQFELSGDRNGNESTDDEVLSNSLSVLQNGMPDILFIHFHGIDDAGHSYGPGSIEESQAIQHIDGAVQQLISELPPGTLVIVFADHGMHAEPGGERAGNHGHLIPEDMLIPILIYKK